MLNGIDPLLLFNFKTIPPALSLTLQNFPLVAGNDLTISLPSIPLYLSRALTGLIVDTEDKNIDIDTQIEGHSDGSNTTITQRPINSTVKIALQAEKDSIGLMVFSALADLILPKITSKEYTISYLHGAVTVFDGLLHSFSINQGRNDTLYSISLELVKPSSVIKSSVVAVARQVGAVPLNGGA